MDKLISGIVHPGVGQGNSRLIKQFVECYDAIKAQNYTKNLSHVINARQADAVTSEPKP